MDSRRRPAQLFFCENNPMHSRTAIEFAYFLDLLRPCHSGAARSDEPGIHRAAETVARRIPGPRLRRVPE